MDVELLSLLQCPRCAAALVPAGKVIECRGCQTEFPVLSGVPCLLPEPSKTTGDWRREAERFSELINEQLEGFDGELKRADLLPSTRQRLERLRVAYRDNGARILDLFRAAGLAPEGRTKASGKEYAFLQYYEQNLRDWAWDFEEFSENKTALDLVSASLGEDKRLGRMLVLGAGPARLAYDLHQTFFATRTVCLDLDPLLFLVANKVLFGGGLTLSEFPSDPTSIDNACVDHKLAPPAGVPTNFHLIAGDAFAPPFVPGSFDTVVTPWFIDIVPVDLRETIAVVHRMLAPGGRWLNYGPLSYPQEHRHGQRYSPEELLELLRAGGFALPGLTRTPIDYMHSRASGRWKKLEVFTFAAERKELAVATDEAPDQPPYWLMLPHLPVPRFAGLGNYKPEHPMLGYLVSIIDGQRSLRDLADKFIAEHGARPDAALEGTRAMLALLYNSVKATSR